MASKINILIVEDNPDHVFLIKQMLLKIPSDSILYFEYDIKDADSLSSAMEVLANNKIDVILLDLGLPDSKDLESLEKILNTYPEMPVIIQTALGRPDVIMNSLNSGAEDYLIKGEYTSNLLIRSIRHSIERRKVLVQKMNSENQMRMLIEKNINPMFVINKDLIIKYINESAVSYFRKQKEELIGNKYGYSFDVDEKIEINIILDNVTTIAEVRTVELKWEDEDSYLITLNDITDMKNKESGLIKEVETFQSFFNDNASIMLLVDGETEKIIQANPAASKFYDLSISELETMQFKDIVAMDYDDLLNANQIALDKNLPYSTQYHKTKSQEKKKVDVYKGKINLTSKIQDYYIIQESTDKTMQMNCEGNSLMSILADDSDRIIIVWDEARKIKHVNKKFSDHFKMGNSIVVGTNAYKYFDFDDSEKLDINSLKSNKVIKIRSSVKDAEIEEIIIEWENRFIPEYDCFISLGLII